MYCKLSLMNFGNSQVLFRSDLIGARQIIWVRNSQSGLGKSEGKWSWLEKWHLKTCQFPIDRMEFIGLNGFAIIRCHRCVKTCVETEVCLIDFVSWLYWLVFGLQWPQWRLGAMEVSNESDGIDGKVEWFGRWVTRERCNWKLVYPDLFPPAPNWTLWLVSVWLNWNSYRWFDVDPLAATRLSGVCFSARNAIHSHWLSDLE